MLQELNLFNKQKIDFFDESNKNQRYYPIQLLEGKFYRKLIYLENKINIFIITILIVNKEKIIVNNIFRLNFLLKLIYKFNFFYR